MVAWATTLDRAWCVGAGWSLRVNSDGGLCLRRRADGPDDVLARRGTLTDPRIVMLVTAQAQRHPAQHKPGYVARARGVPALMVDRQGDTPLLLPLASWAPPLSNSAAAIGGDNARRQLSRGRLPEVLAAAGVPGGAKLPAGTLVEVSSNDGRMINPATPRPRARLLIAANIVAIAAVMPLIVLFATVRSLRQPTLEENPAYLFELFGVPVLGQLVVVLGLFYGRLLSRRRLRGTSLLPELRGNGQLNAVADALMAVDANGWETGMHVADLTARARLREGYGVQSLSLIAHRGHDPVVLTTLSGRRWGSRPEVVSRLKGALGELGVGLDEQRVPRAEAKTSSTGLTRPRRGSRIGRRSPSHPPPIGGLHRAASLDAAGGIRLVQLSVVNNMALVLLFLTCVHGYPKLTIVPLTVLALRVGNALLDQRKARST